MRLYASETLVQTGFTDLRLKSAKGLHVSQSTVLKHSYYRTQNNICVQINNIWYYKLNIVYNKLI